MTDPILQFTNTLFNKLNIQTNFIDPDVPLAEATDLGLRRKILFNDEPVRLSIIGLDPDPVEKHIIYMISDRYRCHYLAVPVPGEEPLLFLAGPYLINAMDIESIHELCRSQNIPTELTDLLSQYYSTLPLFTNESLLEAYVETLGQLLFGKADFQVRYYQETKKQDTYIAQAKMESNENTAAMLAKRYAVEEDMMDAIACGDLERALRCQRDNVFQNLDARINIPLRNMKNYQIILNTLCRKAAQRGGVHPVYLDELSRRIAVQIENADSIVQSKKVERDIVRRYCLLVQSQSTSGYSPAIQEIVNYINIHYSDTDLTLASMAEYFSMNKSYLATRFKKETGMTLTNYVNARRIRQSLYLFNTQSGSVQSIASACGIPDITYFSRLFRREMGMSPTEYRKMLFT